MNWSRKRQNGLIENWKYAIIIRDKYKAHIHEFLPLLPDFQDMWYGNICRVKTETHLIELMGSNIRPVGSDPYFACSIARQFSAKGIQRMLHNGVIELADTELASPIVLAPEKDDSLSFGDDYRKLNAVTVWDSYHLSRMDKYINCLVEGTIVSTVGATSGCWQIEIDERDR